MTKAFTKILICFFLFVFSAKQVNAQCTHTFNMYDSYGDGWNGASVNVLVNGSVVVYGSTIPTGSFGSSTFSANTGNSISLGGWVSGSWNSEISWDIKDGNGTIISSGTYGGSGNSTGNCSASPPCSAGEISVTLNMQDSYGDGWNGNTWTASSTTNSSISYGPFTLPSGSSGSYTFCMDEDCYAIVCNNGSWQSEVSWQLINNVTGSTIVSGGAPYSQSQISVGSGSCSPPPPPGPSAFCDDFESYSNGSYLAATSASWTTWTLPYTASEDVQVTNASSNSGTNSILFSGTSSVGGPSDVVLPFGSSTPYTSGYFSFSAEFYVINGAYFNFQAENVPGITWALDVGMNNGTINFGTYPGSWTAVYLSSSYPINQWFELNIEVDLNSNLWEVFIDGVSQGSFSNPTNQIASLDLFPLVGNQFYVDDVCYEYSTSPIGTYGCTDSTAINYDSTATLDDGSCIYCSSLTASTIVIDESPTGASNGSINLTISGSACSTPPTFIWSNGATTEDIYNLSAGSYSVIITDCNGCTTTTSSTVNSIVGACGVGESEIVITILTDQYPDETSWLLLDQYGGGFASAPNLYTQTNNTLIYSICVPDTNCYSFTILDTYGDGICCGWGNGSYNVTYNGIVVASGGQFNYSEETCNIGVCTPNCNISIPANVIPEGEPCGVDANHGCDDNWKISNFTITDVDDDCSWGYALSFTGWLGIIPCGVELNPDLYVLMTQNNGYYYYSGYYLNTWYPNSFPVSPLLEIPNNNIFTTPSIQTFDHEFSVYDDDDGLFSLLGGDDYLGSYTLPSTLIAGVNSITTSGGPDGNADVSFTAVPPTTFYTPLTNGNTVHGTFWAEADITMGTVHKDTDWYEFTINDSSIFNLSAIAETPFNVMILDASVGCGNVSVIDSAFAYGCDTISMQQTLQPGTYWVVTFPSQYNCISCSDSIDYLLDIAWTDVCNLEVIALATDADCSGNNAQINLTINGGTAPFNYSWNSGDSAQNLQNISIGIYDVLVTDDEGCTDTVSNIVVNPGVLIHDFYVADYVMAFEPTQDFSGWLIDDANNDGYSWSVNQYTGVNSSYGAIYNYNINGTTAADDWLFSQCFVLDSAENYYLSFLSRVASASFPEDMSVFIGSAQESTFMSTQLMQLNNMTNVIYDSLGVLFTVPTSGIYYLGWHAESNANSWRIDLDNINLGLFVQQFGCTDSLAINYDPQATVDDGSCISPFYGCTDSTAANYNLLANIDDGSCIAMVYGCTDSTAVNYYAGANLDDGSCLYNLFGCTDSLAINYDPTVLIDDGSCIYPFYGCTDSTAVNYNPLANIDDSSCVYCVDGCIDTTACNYDAAATCDDGSCILPNGCTDTTACNYDAAATCDDGSCMLPDGCTDSTALNYDSAATCDDGSCMYGVYGCMDSTASNYDSAATIDDGSCIACVYGCMDTTMFNYNPLATCDDGSCIAFVYGCTDSIALNYYAGANIDDGSCIYLIYGCTDSCNSCNYNPLANMDDGSCVYSIACMATGCIDPLALNYDPTACYDDSSCVYCVYGCMDSMALNYDSLATCDDGSCVFVTCGAITGVNLTDVIQDRAIFNWDNMNSASCQVDQIRFRYREVGTSSWSTKTMGVPVGSGCNTSNTSKLVLGLNPSTTYEYDFKIWYCNASTVNWHANGSFTTADVCLNATNMTATPNSNTQTDFCWDAPASPWAFVRLQYRENVPGSSFSNIGGFGVMSPDLCKTKNGLTPGVQYRVMWRTWCNPLGGPYRSPVWDGPVIWDQPLVRLEGGTTIANLEVYPNPSRDVFNVTFTSETIQDLKVRILNIVGEELISDNLEQFVGEYTKHIDLTNNAKGIYFLEIETNEGVINKKLILQ